MYKIRKNRSGRYAGSVLVGFCSLVFMVAASFGIAVVWQNIQDEAPVSGPQAGGDDQAPGEDVEPTGPEGGEPGPAEENKVPKTPSKADQPTESGSDVPADTTRDIFPEALRASGIVPLSYFDDAIFFGDSISTGLINYKVVPESAVIAAIGVQVVNADTYPYIETDEGEKSMLDAAESYGARGKVYIMLGGNSLGYEISQFIQGYRDFLAAVKERYPDALIYLQTMPPVTNYAVDTYPSVNNETINEYNVAIYDLALEQGVYFLDVASALMDGDGKLPDDASPVDGMHFLPEYYAKWLAFLRSHTAPAK